MASDKETVAEIREDVSEYLTSIGPSEYPSETQFEEFADRFEAAHKREVAELRECLKDAVDVACDGCRLAVWKNRKFVKCKRHKNWKCPFGTERWRRALEGAKDGK